MHLSGIITVVVFAIALARHSPKFLEANVRVPAWAFWGIAVFVLNVLAFFLIGLQLGPILSKLSSAERLRSGFIALVVLMTVIVVRFAWVFTAVFLRRVSNDDRKKFESTWAGATLVSWSGMRGTVTVAAALALPQDFPYRDLILTSAFGVTLGTLVLQGLTLKPLLEKLNLVQDNSVETEVNEGRKKTIAAALHAIEQSEKSETASLLEKSYRLQLSRNDRPLKEGETPTASTFEKTAVTSLTQHDRHSAVLAAAIKAQRACLQKLREDNAIGEAAFQKIEEELDWLELGWGQILNLNFVR
jgi:CPA1 family monovalent cation:H+ antiporter